MLQLKAHLIVAGGSQRQDCDRAAAVFQEWKQAGYAGESVAVVSHGFDPKTCGIASLLRALFHEVGLTPLESPIHVFTGSTLAGTLEEGPEIVPRSNACLLPLRLPRSGGEIWQPLQLGDTVQGEPCVRPVANDQMPGQRFYLELHVPLLVKSGARFQLRGSSEEGSLILLATCVASQDEAALAAQGESHHVSRPVSPKPRDNARVFQNDSCMLGANSFEECQESSVMSKPCSIKVIKEERESVTEPKVGLADQYHNESETQRWYSSIPLPTIEPIDPLLYPYDGEEDAEPELEHRRLALLAAVREQETAHAKELQAGDAGLAEMSGRSLAQLNKSVASLEEQLSCCSGVQEAFETEGPQNRDLHLRKVEVTESESVLQTRIVPLSEVVANLSDWREALGAELDSLVSEHRACAVRTEQEVRQMESDPDLEIIRVPGKIVAAVKPPIRKKARLVACGNFLYQSKGRGSPSLNRAIGAYRKWRCASLDVKTAFLTAPLQPPKNASDRKRKVLVRAPRVMSMCNLLPANSWLEVQGALYGLRESPSSWGVSRDEKLRALTWNGADGRRRKLMQCVSDVSLWLVKDSQNDTCIGTLGVYVDDLMFWVEPLELENLLAAVQGLWKCSKPEYADQEGGLTFCGVEIEQDGLETRVHQRTYLRELLKRYDNPRPSITLPEFRSDSGDETPDAESIHAAQKIVAELTWLSGRSRPDISYTVNKLSRMVSKYPTLVKESGLQVMKFLAFAQDWSLAYGSQVSYPQEFVSELPMCRSQLVLRTRASLKRDWY